MFFSDVFYSKIVYHEGELYFEHNQIIMDDVALVFAKSYLASSITQY